MSSTAKHRDHPPQLGALLRLASQVMTDRYARWLASSGYAEIQPAHAAAIQPLWDRSEGARLTTLARAARITKQSMSALVDHLEAHGYVERVADPDDARATRIRLTTRGRAFARAARTFSRAIEAEWAERVGAQRVEALRDTLDVLRKTVFASED